MKIFQSITVLFNAMNTFMNNDTDKDVVRIKSMPREHLTEKKIKQVERDINRIDFLTKLDECTGYTQKDWLFVENPIKEKTLKEKTLKETKIIHIKDKDGSLCVFKNIEEVALYYLKRILETIQKYKDEYCQEESAIFPPLIYTYLAMDIDTPYDTIEKACFSIYERKIRPLFADGFKKMMEYNNIMVKLDEYINLYSIECIDGLPPIIPNEMKHTAIWFVRVFNYYDLVYIYRYLMESELHAPQMFFLAAIDIIRKREQKLLTIDTLGEIKMLELIEKSKTLDKKYRHLFTCID